MTTLGLILRDRSLRLIALGLIAFGTMGSTLGAYQSLIGIERFGFSDGQYALIFMTGSALSLVATLGVGILTDRSAKRRTMARFMALAGMAGAFGVTLTHSPVAFVLAHVLFFPAFGTLFGQLFALARLAGSVHPPERRTAIQTTIRAIFCLPFLVVLPLWAVAFNLGVNLLAVYFVGGVAATALLAIFVFAWPRDGATAWRDTASGLSLAAALGEMARWPVLSRLVLLSGIQGANAVYMITVGLILNAAEGRGPGDVGLFVGIVAGLEMPVILALPWLTARIGLTPALTLGALIYGAFLFALPFLGALPVVWLLIAPGAIGAGVLASLPLLYVQEMMSRRPGTGGSLVSLVFLGGQVISAGVFALGSALGGYAVATTIGAAMVTVCALTLLYADREGMPVQA
ncbi:hypothetical protein [Oceaniglobus trochenteri]|uniref:hypothetical protein n=1 Tax=Oceaniglobus trochenteri TaxID=2763260 RepID=UPI001CFF9089